MSSTEQIKTIRRRKEYPVKPGEDMFYINEYVNVRLSRKVHKDLIQWLESEPLYPTEPFNKRAIRFLYLRMAEEYNRRRINGDARRRARDILIKRIAKQLMRQGTKPTREDVEHELKKLGI